MRDLVRRGHAGQRVGRPCAEGLAAFEASRARCAAAEDPLRRKRRTARTASAAVTGVPSWNTRRGQAQRPLAAVGGARPRVREGRPRPPFVVDPDQRLVHEAGQHALGGAARDGGRAARGKVGERDRGSRRRSAAPAPAAAAGRRGQGEDQARPGARDLTSCSPISNRARRKPPVVSSRAAARSAVPPCRCAASARTAPSTGTLPATARAGVAEQQDAIVLARRIGRRRGEEPGPHAGDRGARRASGAGELGGAGARQQAVGLHDPACSASIASTGPSTPGNAASSRFVPGRNRTPAGARGQGTASACCTAARRPPSNENSAARGARLVMAQQADSVSVARRSPPGKRTGASGTGELAPRLQPQGQPVAAIEGEGVVEEDEQAVVAGEGERDHAALDGRSGRCARRTSTPGVPAAGAVRRSAEAGRRPRRRDRHDVGRSARGLLGDARRPHEARARLGQHAGDGEPLAGGGEGGRGPSRRARSIRWRSAPRVAPVRSSGGARSTGRPAETRTISAATASASRASDATGVAAAARRRTAASARTAQG